MPPGIAASGLAHLLARPEAARAAEGKTIREIRQANPRLAVEEAEGPGPADRLIPAVHAEPLVQAFRSLLGCRSTWASAMVMDAARSHAPASLVASEVTSPTAPLARRLGDHM